MSDDLFLTWWCAATAAVYATAYASDANAWRALNPPALLLKLIEA